MAKRLYRDTQHRVIAGVAAGFGQHLDVDPVLVRLVFLLLLFANGLGLLAYLICWAVIPRGDALESAASPVAAGFDTVREAGSRLAAEVRSAVPDASQAQAVVGSLLVVGGALLLAHNLGWLHWPYWLRFETLWPLGLVALGFGLIVKSRRSTAA